MTNRYNIGYESWQMQFCGEPLQVGQVVTLHLDYRDGEYLNSGFHVDYWEEHHSETTRKVTGKVTEIKAVFIDKFNPATSIHNMDDPDNVYSAFNVTYIDGHSDSGDYCGRDTFDVSYYIVTLEDATLAELENDAP